MVASISCVAKTGLTSTQTTDLFNYICGLNSGSACTGIAKNGTTGVYGAYSMCLPYQQLSFAMNKYYTDQKSASSACDFSGNAKIQSGSTSSTCSALIAQAGTAGTGTVTTVPTGTGVATSGVAASSKAAAGNLVVPRFDFGIVQVGLCVVVAGMTGAGMVLL
jgi:hypothetical protein